MPLTETRRVYRIRKRYLVKGEGWKLDEYDVEGTLHDAWLEASGAAGQLDEKYGNDHFWTVDVMNPQTNSSYVQLFHGRLS